MTNVLFGVIAWGAFYAIVRSINLSSNGNGKVARKSLEEIDLRNRIVSFCHALGCIAYSCYHKFFMDPPECGAINTELHRKCMVFSMSYFVYDTLAMCYDGLMDSAMAIHHPLCIFGLFLPLYENTQGNFAMLAVYLTEISNPSMTLRHILRLSGRRYTKAYEFCEISFLALYTYGRALSGWPIIWRTLSCSSNHLWFKFTCVGLIAQSIFFVCRMKDTALRRYREIQSRKKIGVHYKWFEPISKTELEKLKLKKEEYLP